MKKKKREMQTKKRKASVLFVEPEDISNYGTSKNAEKFKYKVFLAIRNRGTPEENTLMYVTNIYDDEKLAKFICEGEPAQDSFEVFHVKKNEVIFWICCKDITPSKIFYNMKEI